MDDVTEELMALLADGSIMARNDLLESLKHWLEDPREKDCPVVWPVNDCLVCRAAFPELPDEHCPCGELDLKRVEPVVHEIITLLINLANDEEVL
jgi:hypothetical protein